MMEQLREHLEEGKIEANIYHALKNDLERKQVAFARLDQPFAYPHYAIYIALTQFIHLCQHMLNNPAAEVICDALVERTLREIYAKETIFHLNRDKETPTFSALLKWFEGSTLPKPDVIAVVDAYMAEDMQNLHNFFVPSDSANLATDNRGGRNAENSTKRQSLIHTEIRRAEQRLIIDLDLMQLKNMILLGQNEEIGKWLGDVVQGQVAEQLKLPPLHTPAIEKASADKWQHACSVLQLNRIDSVPPRVAAILCNDMAHAHYRIHNSCDELHSYPNEAFSPKEAQLMTTWVIRHCLLGTGSPGDFGQSLYPLTVESSRLTANQQTAPRADPLMHEWANDADMATIQTRFKTRTRDCYKSLREVTHLVSQQMALARQQPYPLRTGFPPPLWLPEMSSEDVE
ncbi:hypothetical protein [Pantoea sp. At-9b]|uniref:hypothetical protein n=1 Tax=Pantoea sp. (strain At-9b) TaxID=592316 RepID=UPI00123716D2|nr:hypothetical protein [Pantoea sp. At-9b]